MRRNRRGVEAIEFAIVVPVLLLVMSGTFDYGWYFHQEMVITDATRHAARAASMTPQTGDPAAEARVAFNTALAGQGTMAADATLELALVTTANNEQAVQVRTRAPYTGLWRMVALPYQLQAQVVMRREDQPATP